MKLLVVTLHFCLKRSRVKYNNKNDKKYNNTNKTENATEDQIKLKYDKIIHCNPV